MSRPSSVQGESDSEPEGLINTLSSNLDSIFSSDSSDEDPSDVDDEIFDNADKPVFLTSKGPVHVKSGQRSSKHLLISMFSMLSGGEGLYVHAYDVYFYVYLIRPI